MQINGHVYGATFYKTKLSELPQKFDKRVIDAMRAQAKVLRASVRAMASGPVLKRRSKTLYKSIFMKTRVSRKSGRLISMVGAQAPHAHFHEFSGFSMKGSGTRISPKPMFKPALRAQTSAIKSAIKDAVLGKGQVWDW